MRVHGADQGVCGSFKARKYMRFLTTAGSGDRAGAAGPMENAKYPGNEANTLRNKSSEGEAGNFGVKADGRTGTKIRAVRVGFWTCRIGVANYGIWRIME
jgi:hypothetical protein